MNETIRRFGYPETLVADYRHWLVLLRPQQPTLGALVLAAKGEFTAFGDLPAEAFSELHRIVPEIEAALARTVTQEKINYLMLMMVDPHVHWHVIPRYSGSRSAEGLIIADAGWPKLPQLAEACALEPAQIAALRERLRRNWAVAE